MTVSNRLLACNRLTQLAPYTLAGYAQFRAVIENDGALPARIKFLFAAVAAINKRCCELAERELRRACEQGLGVEQACGGLILLASLRGEATALAYAELVDRVYGPREDDGGLRPVLPEAGRGEAEANFRAYFGTVPTALARLLALVPRAADGYYLMRRGTIDANPLERKLAELMLVAVLAADYSPMAATHIKAARTAGASEAELAEAALCAVPSAGIAAWMAVGALLDTP